MRQLFNSLAVIGLCGIAPSIAHAAPITFQFSTKVQEIRGDAAGVIGRPVAVDDVLQGHVTWDGAAPDTEPVDPAVGLYVFSGAPYEVALDTRTPVIVHTFAATIVNDLLGQSDGFSVGNGSPNANGVGLIIGIDAPASALWSSDALPDASIPSAVLASLVTEVLLMFPDHGFMRGTLISFDRVDSLPPGPEPPTTVPEPASLLLLGTGLLGASRFRRASRA